MEKWQMKIINNNKTNENTKVSIDVNEACSMGEKLNKISNIRLHLHSFTTKNIYIYVLIKLIHVLGMSGHLYKYTCKLNSKISPPAVTSIHIFQFSIRTSRDSKKILNWINFCFANWQINLRNLFFYTLNMTYMNCSMFFFCF